MDRTPPITTSNLNDSWNIVDSFICQLTAIDYADTLFDPVSGIAATYYTTDGTEPTPTNHTGVGPNYPDGITRFSLLGQGNYIVKFFSVDNNGNTEFTKTKTIGLDNIAPVTTITITPSADVETDWYRSNTLITLASFDAISGVANIKYKWDSGPEQIYVAPFSIPSVGIHTLFYYASDNAGNIENIHTQFFKFDDTAPITQDDAPQDLQKKPVIVSFFSSDDISGVANTYYNLVGGDPSTPGTSVQLTTTTTIKYKSVDNAGNVEAIKQVTVKIFIDNVGPETYASESIPINGTNGWYKSTPTITLTAVDHSGISRIDYKLNPGNLTTTAYYISTVNISATVDLSTNYNISLQIDQNTIYNINVRGIVPAQTTIVEIINAINNAIGLTVATQTDVSGNIDGLGYIKLTSPTAGTGNVNSEIRFLQPANNDATLEVFGLDELHYPYVYVEQVVFRQYVTPLSIPSNGTWSLAFFATDNVGNKGPESSRQYRLDAVKPITICVPSFLPDGLDGWYQTTPEITFQAADVPSGIFKTYYQWNDEIIYEVKSDTKTEIPRQGIQTLKFYSIDLAGNVEDVKTKQFKFTQTAPVTTDNTLDFQGIIRLTSGAGYQQVTNENPSYIGNVIKVSNKNVTSVTKIQSYINQTLYAEYYSVSITGQDQNEISTEIWSYASPLNYTRIGNYEIQLAANISSFDSVISIFNKTNNTNYTIDRANSVLNISLKLEQVGLPISINDVLEVTYHYIGVIPSSSVVVISYYFDDSHEPEVLNSLDYNLTQPLVPFINDHALQVILTATDAYSPVVKTYYTTDGSTPTTSSSQGTRIDLVDDGIYTIKYFSVNDDGIAETVKTAQYQIIIDKNIPVIDNISIISDPLDEGTDGWHIKNFQLQVNISSTDFVYRQNKQIFKAVEHNIRSGINDSIDFYETTTLQAIVQPGLYTSAQLATQVASALTTASANSYVYTVSVIDIPNSETQYFNISSSSNFNLLFSSGIHSPTSIANTIGFDTIDLTSANAYQSQFYKVKFTDSFLKSITQVYTKSLQPVVFKMILPTIFSQTAYDQVLLSTSHAEDLFADYVNYVGIKSVDFGLDTIAFTTTVQVNGDISKFSALTNTSVEFAILFPAISGSFYLQDGQHTIFVQANDNNSIISTGIPVRISKIQHQDFKLDRVPPATTDNTVDALWHKAPVVITLAPTDLLLGSGVNKTYYTTDGSTPTTFSPHGISILLAYSGIYTIKYFSIDNAGNKETVKTALYQVHVDSDAPVTAIFTIPALPDGDNNWFKTQPSIGFSSLDTNSGVNKIWYKKDAGSFVLYTTQFAAVEGTTLYAFYSEDNVGNIEISKTAIIKYDSVAPITTINVSSGYSSDSTIRFTITDASSGGNTTYFTAGDILNPPSDPDLSSPSGNTLTFNTSGTYILKYFSTDLAGNQEQIHTQNVSFDLDAPIISNFSPINGIIDNTTTEITFDISDNLSGVDINSVVVSANNIQYSTVLNSNYFSYTGTPLHYSIRIQPIHEVLNFEDIETLRISGVKDIAGNHASVVEYSFVQKDTTAPWLKVVYPAPNTQDVSLQSNVIAHIDDDVSGVDIKSVMISIDGTDFKINSRKILSLQYKNSTTSATVKIFNNTLTTFIDGAKDVYFSFFDENYNTIKKIQLYFSTLSNYTISILDSRFLQEPSSSLLTVHDVDILAERILDLYLPQDNLNFSFLQRDKGYLVFANPNFNFKHKVPVNVTIKASDNNNNVMQPFSYIFIPHQFATPSIAERNYLNKNALQYISDIQSNMASPFSRSRSTNYYAHHKSLALELSRFQEQILFLDADRHYSTLRPEHLYDKLGYLLLTPPTTSSLSQQDYRRLLQSLISILFQGSTKKALEQGASLFLQSDVQIIEIVFSEGSDISQQFTFTADVLLGQSSLQGIDLITLSSNLTHVFNLVKPAHVYIIQRFIWSDQFNFQAGCALIWQKDIAGDYILDQFGNKIPVMALDGMQAAITTAKTAICDRYSQVLSNDYFEDVREDCSTQELKIITITEDVSLQFTGTQDNFICYWYPLLKDASTVATISDVTVTVNGFNATVLNVNALTGYVQINVFPQQLDEVIVTYKYNKNFVYRAITFFISGGNNNQCTISGINFLPNIGSVFNNVNYTTIIMGGIEVSNDLRLHAHVCETLTILELEEKQEDTYIIPSCNNKKFFFLNVYTLSAQGTIENTFMLNRSMLNGGNVLTGASATNLHFNESNGSYLNDPNAINRSTMCPLFFWDMEQKLDDQIDLPIEKESSKISDFIQDQAKKLEDQLQSFKLTFQDKKSHLAEFTLDDESTSFDSNNDLLGPAEEDELLLLEVDEVFEETIDAPVELKHELKFVFTDTKTFRLNISSINESDVLTGYRAKDQLINVHLSIKPVMLSPMLTAFYTSIINMTTIIDLSINYNIELEIDKSGVFTTIDLRGTIPSQTTITEIITNINANINAIYPIATETDQNGNIGTGYITVTSPTSATGNPNSQINFAAPVSNDATQIVFGLNADYPHKFFENPIVLTPSLADTFYCVLNGFDQDLVL